MYPNKEIRVHGFRWCKEEPKQMPIGTLKQKVLCKRHNGQLGEEVDEAGRFSVETLASAMDLLRFRDQYTHRRWNIQHFRTDMWRLERWCLKTLINLNLAGSGFDFDTYGVHTAMSPPLELVEVAFGKQFFSDAKGLYITAKQGANIDVTEGWLSIGTTVDANRLVGADFLLWGVPFYLNLLPTLPPKANHDTHFMRRNVKQWYQTRDDKQRLVRSHLLTFTYPDTEGSIPL
jgi:hypothetical protein